MRTMKAITIEEIKYRRVIYGHDEHAINKHSTRIYMVSGVRKPKATEFTLNRTLDGCPPFFELCYFKGDSFSPTHLKVNGEQYWGDGLSWPKAEQQAFKAITAFLGR
jgi:hypothetical protein